MGPSSEGEEERERAVSTLSRDKDKEKRINCVPQLPVKIRFLAASLPALDSGSDTFSFTLQEWKKPAGKGCVIIII